VRSARRLRTVLGVDGIRYMLGRQRGTRSVGVLRLVVRTEVVDGRPRPRNRVEDIVALTEHPRVLGIAEGDELHEGGLAGKTV